MTLREIKQALQKEQIAALASMAANHRDDRKFDAWMKAKDDCWELLVKLRDTEDLEWKV